MSLVYKSEYQSLSERIRITKTIIALLQDVAEKTNNICFSHMKKSKQRDIINLSTKLSISPLFKDFSSKDTLDSETWISCIPSKLDEKNNELDCIDNESAYIAVKIMPITLPEYELFIDSTPSEERFGQNDRNVNSRTSKAGSLERRDKLFKHKVWKEIHVLELCRALTMAPQGIPNLPIIYSWNICNKHNPDLYVNKNIIRAVEARKDTDEYGQRLAILFNELADKNLYTWLIERLALGKPNAHSGIGKADSLEKMKNEPPDIKKEIDNMLFGILAGLVALETNIGLVHFDLHLANILVIEDLKYKEGEYYKYTYGNKAFYVPNIGTMMYIWDFSLCGLRGENDAFFIRNMLKYGKRLIDKDLFTSKAEILAKNIVNKGYAEYLYSYDTFRVAQGLYRVIDEHAQKWSSSTVSRGSGKTTWNSEFSNKIEDILDMLYDIREDARDDLTKRLLRNTRGAVKHSGRPLDILLKYFKKWNKLPAGGKVLKEFKIDLKLSI